MNTEGCAVQGIAGNGTRFGPWAGPACGPRGAGHARHQIPGRKKASQAPFFLTALRVPSMHQSNRKTTRWVVFLFLVDDIGLDMHFSPLQGD